MENRYYVVKHGDNYLTADYTWTSHLPYANWFVRLGIAHQYANKYGGRVVVVRVHEVEPST